MQKLLLSTALLGLLASPASARLQISISDGVNPTFTCFDGQGGCDLGGGANNLLTLNTTVGNFFISGTLTTSSFGDQNNLDLSSFSVINNGLAEGTIKLLVSDTGFTAPATTIGESASLTFHNNVGAKDSKLQFWADPADVQGANPVNTPGPLLFTALGTALTNPDSFDGTHQSSVNLTDPFSMTEGAALDLLAGGSVTGFNQDMLTSSIPEAKTWTMAALGFALLGLVGLRKRRENRVIA